MALPSSGQISMGDINVELGRTRTTGNTKLAGGSTPISTSLFGLATSSVNKTAPHKISEFHGYTHANYGAFIYDANESSNTSICLFLFHRDESDFNTTLSVADYTRIVNGTTGQEMDYDFAGSVDGNSDKFGIVLVINGSLSRKILRVDDDNEMTSVTNC
jgi:hypothetical protein